MGVIYTFIMGLLMSFEPITDNDWFWHYVIGHYINDNHVIPKQELFTWHGPYPWTSHEWLTELIMYKLGPLGCLIIMLVIFLFLYILMAKMLRVKMNKLFDFRLVYLLMMTVFFKVTGPRPYILSLLFLAYLVYILFSYLDNEKKFGKLIYTIPILQMIWVNFHGGSSSLSYIFLIGILLCDLFLQIFKFDEKRWTTFRLSKSQVKTLLIVLALTIIASGINPFGYSMLLYPFSNMMDNNMIDLILEWQSASFHGFFGIYIFIVVFFPILNLVFTKDKMKFHELAFQFLLLFMAMRSQRFIGMYAIYSMWNLGKYFFVTDDMYEILRRPFKKIEKLITYAFCGVLVVSVFYVSYIQLGTISKIGVIDNDGFYSDTAIKKVIELKPKRLYNDFGAGGYLLYKLDEFNALDDIKIYSYGLGDVFSKKILPDSIYLAMASKRNPKELLDEYDFDVFITTKGLSLRYYLDILDDYELYYSDDMCYIYIKK